MQRYGKPSADLLQLKQAFFRDNDRLAEDAARVAESYTSQPLRTKCKNCDEALGGKAFHKHGVDYVVCERCTHLNGAHEDSSAFLRALYTDDGGASYGADYAAESAEAFAARVARIYRPKAQFLLTALSDMGVDPLAARYADLGAGTG